MTTPCPSPRATVLMAVLNPDPVYFPQAVRSILAQTLTDFELLIIEDPSPRPAAPLLRPFHDRRICHHLNPQRTSLPQQKNQGLAAARGDLVAMFDADDIAEPDRLAKQVRFLERHPEVTVLGSQIRIIDQDGRPRGYRQFPLNHEAILHALPSFVPLSHPSVMLRKRPVLAAGGYCFHEYPAAEDYELWSRLAQRGERFANHPEALLRYRVHPGQIKYRRLRDTIRAILRVKQMHWADTMDFWARGRSWIEWSMLALPPWLVLRLFMLTQYRNDLTSAAPPNTVRAASEENADHDAQVLHRRLSALRDDLASASLESPSSDCHPDGDEVLFLPTWSAFAGTSGSSTAD